MVRQAVPRATQAEVLAACRRRCAICFGLNRDTRIKAGQIAHLDRNAANASFDNQVFLCLEHHDQFDSKTSQSKGLTSDEVRQFRQELTAAIKHAWSQPITFGSVEVTPTDTVSGRWVRGNDVDSAEIEVERTPDNRLRVHGFALHGKTRNIGPNIGELDFEGDLIDQAVTFVNETGSGQSYTLRLRFLGDRLIADEQGAFGYFGVGAHLGGEYLRPMSDLITERATPVPASQRVTIRENSAAEILSHLKGITPPSRFHETVEGVYLGRWTREPGWQATVYDLPSKPPGGNWHCTFKEVGSGAIVFATSLQDVSSLRPGDSVIVSGRIRDISQLDYVSIEDAIVRDDNVLTRKDILRNDGWVGAEWEQKFLAYDGPLEGLRLIEDRPFQQAMATALAAQGFRPHLSEIKNLATHADEGSRVVHLTDQKTWRQRLTRGMAVLTARPADSPA